MTDKPRKPRGIPAAKRTEPIAVPAADVSPLDAVLADATEAPTSDERDGRPFGPADARETIAQADETLDAIADRLGVSAGDLFDANRGLLGSTAANLRPGHRLAVPAAPPAVVEG